MALLTKKDVLKTYKSKEAGLKVLKKYNSWFPVYPSPELAGVIGDLIGDGHLQGSTKWRIDYTSKNIGELNRFGKIMFQLFGVRGKIRPCKTNKFGKTFNYGINCKPLARMLSLLGAPYGSKVLRNFSIPSWILNDRLCFRSFIRRLFSCEACVDFSKNPAIEIKMYKRLSLLRDGLSFMREIKHYLDVYFNIKCCNPFLEGGTNKRKDSIKTKGVRLKIKGEYSLKNYYNLIGFDDKLKMYKLSCVIKS